MPSSKRTPTQLSTVPDSSQVQNCSSGLMDSDGIWDLRQFARLSESSYRPAVRFNGWSRNAFTDASALPSSTALIFLHSRAIFRIQKWNSQTPMRLTPIQIRKQEFEKKLRGYDPDEVDAFLAAVASDFEELLRENMDLKTQKSAIVEELQNYKKLEESLRSLIVQAEKTATESTVALKSTSEIIRHEAEAKAKQVLNAAMREVEEAKGELAKLKDLKESIITSVRAVLSAQLDILNSLESKVDKQEVGEDLLDVRSIIESMEKSENGK